MSTKQQLPLPTIWTHLWDQKSLKEWRQKVQGVFLGKKDAPVVVNLDVCNKFLEVSENYESYSELAEILSKDAGLATDVLKIINSALYGFDLKFDNLQTAVSLLGPEKIASMIIIREIKKVFEYTKKKTSALAPSDRGYYKRRYEEIYGVSVITSRLVRELYLHINKIKNPRNIDFDLVAMGLFSRLSDLVVLTYFLATDHLDEYRQYCATGRNGGLGLEAEQVCFGLLHEWRFPEIYQICIACDFSVTKANSRSDGLAAAFGPVLVHRVIRYVYFVEACKLLLSEFAATGVLKELWPSRHAALKDYQYEPSDVRALQLVGVQEEQFIAALRQKQSILDMA